MSDSSSAAHTRKFDTALEGLRGFACMIVLFSHLSGGFIRSVFFPGVEAVLIFFLISGYVIGRVYDGPYSPEAVREYRWRRFVRLWPLNFFAVLFSVAVYPVDGIGNIVANMFFLQNWEAYPGFRLPPLKANWNLWSLNNEIVYYAIFLLFWRNRISSRSLIKLIGVLIVLSLTGWLWRDMQPKFITSYCFGAVFWCSGLWLGWYGKAHASTDEKGARMPWVSIWLLLLATVQFHVPFSILDYFGYGWGKHSQISFVNMEIFPLAFIILVGATAKVLPMPRLWWTLALIQPVLMLELNAFRGEPGLLTFDEAGIGNLLTLCALILWPLKLSNYWLSLLCPIGLISYGIYIFQAPAINLVELHGPYFADSWGNYLFILGGAVALTFAIAYLGERILQPRIRRFLDQRFGPARNKKGGLVAQVP